MGGHAILSSGMASQSARRWFVRGRVQGVGFRYFAQRAAAGLGLHGYACNLDDGRVEVYAVGPEEKLAELAGILHVGPRWADVRGVDEQDAEIRTLRSFEIH
jgi:acylphosphatase